MKPKSRQRGPVPHDRRSTWDRLCQIDHLIRSGTYPNLGAMAARLGVTPRTITRDLDFLKHERQLPIAYDPRRYGFYYTKPVAGLPQTPFTEADLVSVLVAHKSFAQHPGTPFEKPLRQTLEKLTGQLNDRERDSVVNLGNALSFRPFAPEDCDRSILNTVTKAVTDRRQLKFRYRNWGQKRVIPRRLQPYHVVCCDSCWYLVGYDVRQCAIRTFALSRLLQPKPTRRRFPPPKRFNLDAYFKGSLGVMKGTTGQTYEVIIELDVCGTDLVRGRRWHPTQQMIDLPDGRSRLTLRLSSLEEIERAVLSWGTHATVIGPDCLRQRLASIASELSALYADSLSAVGDEGDVPPPPINTLFQQGGAGSPSQPPPSPPGERVG